MVQGRMHDTSNGTKLCPNCQLTKPFLEFGSNKRSPHGISTYCKPCTNERQRVIRASPEGGQKHRDATKSWRQNNVTRHADNNRKWRYGVAHGTYDKLFELQNGKCAICKTTEAGGKAKNFHVDHCHSTNFVRGLLCTSCNSGLGRFKDSEVYLRAAADYLSKGRIEC